MGKGSIMAEIPAPPPGFDEPIGTPPPPPGFDEVVSGPATFTKTADTNDPGVIEAVMSYARPLIDNAGPLVDTIKKAALPLAGQLGGAAAGLASPVPGGVYMGEAVGAMVGEYLNQKLGITEQSMGEVVLAGAMPGVARGVIGGTRLAAGEILKVFGGRQAVVDIAESITKRILTPKVSSEQLFTRALAKSGSIPMSKTAQAVEDIATKELGNLPTDISAAIKSALQPIAPYVTPQPAQMAPSSILNQYGKPVMTQVKAATTGTHNIEQISTAVKDLRLQASLAYKSGNSRLGNILSNVRNAIFDDAASSGVPELREAAKAYRKEAAIEELGGVLRQAQPLKAYKDLQDKNALFRDVFSNSEQATIKQIMSKLSTAAPSGFSGVLGRTITAAGGQAVGGPAGAVAGAMMPDMAAYALTTSPGRKLMEKLLVGNVWDANKTAALATWFRAARAEDAQAGDIAENVSRALKDTSVPIEEKIKTAQERDQIRRGASGSY
jgi:hypothetical protein